MSSRGPVPGRRLAGVAGLVTLGALALVMLGAVVLAVRDRGGAAEPGRPDPPPRLAASVLTAMFARYGDTGGQWNGGDDTASVPLPDGRVAWLFSDTYLGRIGADHKRPRTAPFLHNTIVVQQGRQPAGTLHGGDDSRPGPLVGPATGDDYYWAQDGTVEGDRLRVFYNRYHRTGGGLWDFTLTGSALATFGLPGLRLEKVTELPLGDKIAWGSAVLEDGGHVYVYGAERTTDAMRFAHVARVPAGGLGGSWEFWTGQGWSPSAARSARLLSGVGTGYSVQRAGDQYVLLTTEGNLLFNPSVVAYTSASPTGPWAGPRQVFTPPEAAPGTSRVSYDARLHPELARPGKLLISYNVNSLDPATAYADARVYRPRFVEVDWPPAAPASGLPAPAGLTAAVNDVHPTLRWSPVPGAERYWLYERDVTAGQTHPARRPQPVTGTSTDAGLLRDGHTYEFRVTAARASGESALSDVVRATRTRPTVPDGLAAEPLPDGRITLSWADPGADLWYWVDQRDATAGERRWRRDGYPVDGKSGYTTGPLVHGHAYEFRIVAIGPSGESAPSAVARATARYAPPPPPAGLRVTPGDGRADAVWTAPAPGLIYHIYYRDVTARQDGFTRGRFPLTEPSAIAGPLVNGHTYEFRVTAERNGSESDPSPVVRAVPRAPLPAAPKHLTARTTGPGTVTVTWDELGGGVHYWLFYRDVTAGQTEFAKGVIPFAAPPADQPFLIKGHVYEVTVSAESLAGQGPRAKPVTVTVNR